MNDFTSVSGRDFEQAPAELPVALPEPMLVLQRQYLAALPARIAAVCTHFQRWKASNFDDLRASQDLYQELHKLSGAAGTFGLMDVSLAARAVEQQVVRMMSGGVVARSSALIKALHQAHDKLQDSAAAAAGEAALAARPSRGSVGDWTSIAATEVLGTMGESLPWRILLVDDDELLLQAHASILREAGMVVVTQCQPEKTMDAVLSFKPDVLLLDVYMPGMDGPEVASVLRREEALLHLPILFLSAETDLTQQLLALNLGGDDFLIKPVQPQHLVAAVTARARRARQNLAVQRRLETALYEREREHLALDHHAIVSIADHTGTITYANPLFCQVTGYAASELEGQTYKRLLDGLQPTGFMRTVWSTVSAGRVWHGEICARKKNGDLCWLKSTVTPFLDAQDRVYQFVAIQTDITHIKAAEAALRRQRDMQRVISDVAARLMGASHEQTGAAIHYALSESGRELGVDQAYLFTFSSDGQKMRSSHLWSAPDAPETGAGMLWSGVDGVPWMRDRFLREDVVAVADVADLPAEAAADRLLLQSRGVRALLVLPVQKGGMPFGFIGYSASRASRQWTADEIELLKVLADVMGGAMSRQRAETALRASEARLNFLVSSSPVTIYTVAAQSPHTLTYVSPNVRALTGLDAAALRGLSGRLTQAVHPQDVDLMDQHWAAVLADGQHGAEYRLDPGDGQYRWIHDQCLLVRDAEGQPVELIGYWMDIDLRKRAEHALEVLNHELEHRVEVQTRNVMESERVAHATLDAMSARVVILDSAGVVLAANRAWKAVSHERQVLEGDNYLQHCQQFGSHASSAGPALAAGFRAVIRGEQPSFLREYSVSEGSDTQWFVCRAERFPGEGAVRLVVSHEDITQMKLVERQQLRSQRLESLGTLAGGVAHDLNNALAPILMGMGMLKEQFPQEARLFDLMHGSARRGADMVRQLLTFARGIEGERVPVQVERLIREIGGLVQGSFPKNIQLLVHCEPELPLVIGDSTQLHQILLNLCVNARDAMTDGGVIQIRVQREEVSAAHARSVDNAKPGTHLVIRVSDSGTGICPDILDRIFDPFFTTKSSDRGTGLGLSTVLGLVKSHGGFLQVQSRLGEGSTFAVFLPAALTNAPAPVAVERQSIWRGQGEAVLFVDDESAVREVGRSVLERLNFKPLLAKDGADALLQLAAHRGELRAVVSDLHMPNMDGLAFVRALRQTDPDLPVVMASGRVDAAVTQALDELGVTARLDKPFTEAQMARALADLLVTANRRSSPIDARKTSLS